jgi:hypothetical protein
MVRPPTILLLLELQLKHSIAGKFRIVVGAKIYHPESQCPPTTSKFQWRVRTMRSTTFEQPTPEAAQVILEQLPGRIRVALINRATEIKYPVEAVIEMAIAGYLDNEALRFADCKPGLDKL